jgi:hydroxymethylpyrimidine/phosphomethylpyrimidine kinase
MRSCALTIAGLDPGGGAGVAADLRAFHAAGAFGCAVVALLTVQSTDGLVGSKAVPAKLVVAQAAEVVRAQSVRAVKLGALGSPANVRAVARWLGTLGAMPVVLDPVMLPTRGDARLLAVRGVEVLRDVLLPRATLVTANAPEAAALTGRRVRTVDDARRAATRLVELGARNALVKGGHLATRDEAVDVLALEGGRVVDLSAPRQALPPTHGGGCILASLIAGRLAATADRGRPASVLDTVRFARGLHQRALRDALRVGGAMRVLDP